MVLGVTSPPEDHQPAGLESALSARVPWTRALAFTVVLLLVAAVATFASRSSKPAAQSVTAVGSSTTVPLPPDVVEVPATLPPPTETLPPPLPTTVPPPVAPAPTVLKTPTSLPPVTVPAVVTSVVGLDEWKRDLLSIAIDGGPGNADSIEPTASGDGQLVAFASRATNLVVGDTNGLGDVFVRDVARSETTRVLGSAGAEPDGPSYSPAISGDGRIVVFISQASNLVEGDTNRLPDVFAFDRATSATRRVTTGTESIGGVTLSADGSTYAYASGDGAFAGPMDGHASLLAPGGQSPSLSADGRYVAFTTALRGLAQDDDASNQDVYVTDRSTSRVELASGGADGSRPNAGSFSGARSLSADGRRVAFISVARLTPEDTNGAADVYVRDLAAGVTRLVPADGGGSDGNASYRPSISPDGNLVAYTRPAREPMAIAWTLSTNKVRAITGKRGPPQSPLNGLTIVGAAFVASTPEGALLGQDRWASQVIRLR